MSELRCLHQATVTEDQIDHLGHMNVRYYGTRAVAATNAFLAEHGLDERARRALGLRVSVPRAYTRHYREQLVGARLGVMSGVLATLSDGLRLYHELVNLETDELAAALVYEVRLRDDSSRAPRPLPEAFVEGAGRATVAWPDRGRPRSIDLTRLPDALTLDEARTRDLAMRQPRTLRADECDADGLYPELELPELVWGGEPVGPAPAQLPLHTLSDGRPFGWAVMESRRVTFALPCAGDRVQSFSAHVDIGRKTVLRHQWVFDLDHGHLVCTWSSLDLAFDVGARRSIEIPDEIRARLEPGHHPDLR